MNHGDCLTLEKEWKQYPVIRLDMSTAKGHESPAKLREKMLLLMKSYKEEFGCDPDEKTPGRMLMGLISRAHYGKLLNNGGFADTTRTLHQKG